MSAIQERETVQIMRIYLARELKQKDSWTPEQVLSLFDDVVPDPIKPSNQQAECGHFVHGGILGCSCD